ncbi:BlaI/MecI/CopY family transcriptional regulator [Alkalihalobacillus oceani]|uniref:BlaI/MecI/CopY family transcriptional regulator n=1 Tax=Halalkalibacter oceani TaxID=1653776 RepID=UPI00203CCCA7|nr:BlaI/MecI/CopY family transcriptional regulator [Halalkalibacter oceani]
MNKLPDTEFSIMKVVWGNDSPITTNLIMQELGNEKGWKTQTVSSLLSRLVKRGFIRSEKSGKERHYHPLISEEEYLKFETNNFIERFHANSFSSLVATLYSGNKLKDRDLDQLEKWLKEQRD